jgi:transcriptional regulator with XRE-family HTH domain
VNSLDDAIAATVQRFRDEMQRRHITQSDLGDRIGLTQSDLGDRIGLTQSSISGLLNLRHAKPELATLWRIATGLGLEIDITVRRRTRRPAATPEPKVGDGR